MAFVMSNMALDFIFGLSRGLCILHSKHSLFSLDGDKRPTLQEDKTIRLVSKPLVEHLKKIKDNRNINCTAMKYVKVPSPGYGVVMTICTLGSLDWNELYKISILDYPFCSCLDFKFMKARANRKHKWLPCKHLYFILQ